MIGAAQWTARDTSWIAAPEMRRGKKPKSQNRKYIKKSPWATCTLTFIAALFTIARFWK
jgi:hypothetical protein